MSSRISMKTILIVIFVLILAGILYGLYQKSNAEQERLRQDTVRIQSMITEDNARQP